MTALRSALTGLLLWGLTFPLTEACGWTTTALNGTVQSPDFPGNYPNNQSCVYIITAPEGYQVTLNFTDLDIDPSYNCTDDFVEIRDGDNETSPLIGRYCNQTLPGRRRTFGNQMWIKFVSDGSATGQGFRAAFVSDIDECAGSHSCDQVCHNTAGNYRCSCSTGYTVGSDQRTCVVCDSNHWGDNCSLTCDCSPVGTQRCDRVTGCVCRSGWQGAQCQQDTDECSRAPCSNLHNSHCVNTAGSFRCLCGDGYGMNAEGNACVDINECHQQPGPCDQHCTNTEGSYLCSCQQGFTVKGSACVDINECLTNPCDQICRNTVGGYLCECQAGYILNATTRKTCIGLNKGTDSAAVSSTVIAVASAVSVLVIVIIIVVVVIIVLRRRKKGPSDRTQLQKDPMSSDLGSSRSQPSEVPTTSL